MESLEQIIEALEDKCKKEQEVWSNLSKWQQRKRRQDFASYYAVRMGERFAYSVVLGLINRQGNEEEMQKFLGQVLGESSE